MVGGASAAVAGAASPPNPSCPPWPALDGCKIQGKCARDLSGEEGKVGPVVTVGGQGSLYLRIQ